MLDLISFQSIFELSEAREKEIREEGKDGLCHLETFS